MKNLHLVAENGSRNGVSGLEMRPDQEPASIHVKVSHGPNEFVVVVPSNSSFGMHFFLLFGPNFDNLGKSVFQSSYVEFGCVVHLFIG